jgi:hypothetical protein
MGLKGDVWNDIVLRLLRGMHSPIAKKLPRKMRAVHHFSSIVIFTTTGAGNILSVLVGQSRASALE